MFQICCAFLSHKPLFFVHRMLHLEYVRVTTPLGHFESFQL